MIVGFPLALAALLGGSAQAASLGDVDGDGKVTVRDAVRLLDRIARNAEPSSQELLFGDLFPAAGDGMVLPYLRTLGDGRITQEDVFLLLRTALGMEPKREIGPAVFTLAGSGPQKKLNLKTLAEQSPHLVADGGAEAIYLFDPWDLALGPNGEIYFTEYLGHRIRVLEPNGTVRTIAGSLARGHIDKPGGQARFYGPMGLALLPDGSLVIADSYNHSIRKVTPQGVVSTFAGSGRPGDGTQFNTPNGVAADPQGNVYVADTNNHRICKVDPKGRIITLAGGEKPGTDDGPALEARFHYPTGLCYDSRNGSLFITDMANQMIRKLTPDGEVVTVAGRKKIGHVDGAGPEALFNYPYGCDVDPQGRVWIADWFNQSVRVMETDGTVRTVAGTLPFAYMDGPAEFVKLKGLMNVRFAPNGAVYLADTDNQRIRVLVP